VPSRPPGCAGAICTKINCNGRGYPRRRKPPQRMHPPGRTRSAQQRASRRRAPGVPIANEDRLVVPNTLGTTIKLTSSASWGPLSWRQRTQPAGRCCHLYIGPTVVTCLEIRWPPGFWFSGLVPSRYSQPRAGRAATECERGRGLSALADTPPCRLWCEDVRCP
jgi:hypothetical protein